jgi:hypothetical protein
MAIMFFPIYVIKDFQEEQDEDIFNNGKITIIDHPIYVNDFLVQRGSYQNETYVILKLSKQSLEHYFARHIKLTLFVQCRRETVILKGITRDHVTLRSHEPTYMYITVPESQSIVQIT